MNETLRDVIENAQLNLKSAIRVGGGGAFINLAMSQIDTVVQAIDSGKELDDTIDH